MQTGVIADETAQPGFCAADLIAQAEHDPLATAILVTPSQELLRKIEAELDIQLAAISRGDMARAALERQGRVVLLNSLEEAVELANRIAPEHLCLMIADPWAWAGKVKNAGGLFLGEFSPEVMGDYVAGPSHVMPTGGTARFNSYLSVNQFLKRTPVVALDMNTTLRLARTAADLARTEGFDAHARSAELRVEIQDSASPGESPTPSGA